MNNRGFVAGTLVHTDKGLVPIQDIKVGDLILSKPVSSKSEDGVVISSTNPYSAPFNHPVRNASLKLSILMRPLMREVKRVAIISYAPAITHSG